MIDCGIRQAALVLILTVAAGAAWAADGGRVHAKVNGTVIDDAALVRWRAAHPERSRERLTLDLLVEAAIDDEVLRQQADKEGIANSAGCAALLAQSQAIIGLQRRQLLAQVYVAHSELAAPVRDHAPSEAEIDAALAAQQADYASYDPTTARRLAQARLTTARYHQRYAEFVGPLYAAQTYAVAGKPLAAKAVQAAIREVLAPAAGEVPSVDALWALLLETAAVAQASDLAAALAATPATLAGWQGSLAALAFVLADGEDTSAATLQAGWNCAAAVRAMIVAAQAEKDGFVSDHRFRNALDQAGLALPDGNNDLSALTEGRRQAIVLAAYWQQRPERTEPDRGEHVAALRASANIERL